jgi:hypothetical protein
MVRLKIKRSTPRRVLNTEPALLPPKALPRPAPRTWSRIKRITATDSMICMTRIAGSQTAKIYSSLSSLPIDYLRNYITLFFIRRELLPLTSFYVHEPECGRWDIKQQNAADCSDQEYCGRTGQYAVVKHHVADRRQGRCN